MLLHFTRRLFAKIHKDQASQLETLRHTKRAMDKSIASKDGADPKAVSLASLVSYELFISLCYFVVSLIVCLRMGAGFCTCAFLHLF